ncbi:hypothetical protein BD833_1185 [Blastococcus xanthinilyticus]|uniref:Uncharacterized protein n=2 Tax=Blastococcus xanthinilyticus TaxID=1564164 RepID=A0A5S5CPI5_9ACTN|nr:hypothetical protein BD833_1185 [Blastococcus xanthinilyticus]
MVEVAWPVIHATQVEQVIAVFLSREHPHALRITPSQGDKGLDVIVEQADSTYHNFQVKYFATNLNSSQKRQIKKSLASAISLHNDKDSDFDLSLWILTMPWNPTTQQLGWFRQIQTDLACPFSCEWRGLDYVNGLASKYPQVVDYHLGNDKSRLEQRIKDLENFQRLRALAGMPSADSTLVPQDLLTPLAEVVQAINRDDPHYQFSVEAGPYAPPAVSRPGLIASTTIGETQVGPFVTFHVYARYRHATDDRPLPLTIHLNEAALTEMDRAAWQDAIRFGSPVTLAPGSFTLDIDLPGGLGVTNGEGTLRLFASDLQAPQPGPVRWVIVGPASWSVIAEIEVQNGPATRGVAGGIEFEGIDSTGIMTTRTRATPNPNGTFNLNVTISLAPEQELIGLPVAQALQILRFIDAYKPGNRLAFGPRWEPIVRDSAQLIQIDAGSATALISFLTDLNLVSNECGAPASVPNWRELTRQEFLGVRNAARVLAGSTARLEVHESYIAELAKSDIEMLPKGEPVAVTMPTQFELKVAEQKFVLPFTEISFSRITIESSDQTSPDPDRGFIVFRPMEGCEITQSMPYGAEGDDSLE